MIQAEGTSRKMLTLPSPLLISYKNVYYNSNTLLQAPGRQASQFFFVLLLLWVSVNKFESRSPWYTRYKEDQILIVSSAVIQFDCLDPSSSKFYVTYTNHCLCTYHYLISDFVYKNITHSISTMTHAFKISLSMTINVT